MVLENATEMFSASKFTAFTTFYSMFLKITQKNAQSLVMFSVK